MPSENSIVSPPIPRPDAASDAAIAAARQNLRKTRIAAREALPAADRARFTTRIEAHLDALLDELAPRTVAFCWPWRGEVDLVPWARRWLAADTERRMALPMVRTPGTPMVFLHWHPEVPMETDHHGIPIPSDTDSLQPELILVPLNVFDAAGYRLGYGGGYFDRTLAALQPAPLCVGVAFELARVDNTFPQPHDQPMDWIVTEAGATRAVSG